MPKKDLLAFQRAEKEKYMSSKPSGKQLPHQVTAYIAKPIMTSNTKQLVGKLYQMFICVMSISNDNLIIISDENPTVSRPSVSTYQFLVHLIVCVCVCVCMCVLMCAHVPLAVA